MRTIKRIICVIIVVVIAFFYAHVDKLSYFYDRKQDTGDYIATGILTDRELTQEFVIDTDRVTGVQVKATVYGEVEDVEVFYKLIDNESEKAICEGTIPGTDFENNRFYDLDFDTKEPLGGKNVTLVLGETGSDETNGIGFSVGVKGNSGISGELYVGGNSTAGTLVARTVDHGFDIETFVIFLAFIAYIVIFMKILYKLFK